MERKICIIFVGNKKLRIMSRTIVEVHQYFDERPELWGELSEVIDDGTDPKKPHSPVSVGKWGESLTGGIVDGANSRIASSIMDAFGKLDESIREAGEEFKRWYLGEWQEEHVVCYKGFNKDLTCLDFEYEVGKEYEMEGAIRICERGFRACKNPMDVLNFYMGIDTRYCVVEQWGYMEEKGRKTVSSNIKVVREISLKELFEIAMERKVWNKAEMYSGKGYMTPDPSLYNDNIQEIKDISLWGETFVGTRGEIIVRENLPNVANIMGNENIIGVMAKCKKNNVLGSFNDIYVLDCDNDVNITGNLNKVYVAEVKDTQINVQGVGNHISIKGKADVVCVGENNAVQAGIGSTITFVDGTKSMSVFIDGETYTDKMVYWTRSIINGKYCYE